MMDGVNGQSVPIENLQILFGKTIHSKCEHMLPIVKFQISFTLNS